MEGVGQGRKYEMFNDRVTPPGGPPQSLSKPVSLSVPGGGSSPQTFFALLPRGSGVKKRRKTGCLRRSASQGDYCPDHLTKDESGGGAMHRS